MDQVLDFKKFIFSGLHFMTPFPYMSLYVHILMGPLSPFPLNAKVIIECPVWKLTIGLDFIYQMH